MELTKCPQYFSWWQAGVASGAVQCVSGVSGQVRPGHCYCCVSQNTIRKQAGEKATAGQMDWI